MVILRFNNDATLGLEGPRWYANMLKRPRAGAQLMEGKRESLGITTTEVGSKTGKRKQSGGQN